MADPYRTNPHPHDSSLETDDMSSFLLNLLHDSSASASAAAAATFSRSATVPSDSDFRVRDGALAAVIESSSSLNLSDPSRFYAADLENGVENVFSANRSVFPEDDKVQNFDFSREEYEAFEMPNNQVQPRSSKRCRSADVHNMSEKRRRSRINEKLKALQTLIPNSNKTDKASMLDEAIEYLKQLQLQVQMLTMRNGLSLYPGYIPSSAQSMQLPPSGIEFDVGNVMLSANRGVTLPGSEGMMQTAFEISNQNPSTKPTITSNNTGNSIDLGTTIQNHYGLLNQLASSKNMCRDDTLSRLHLDMSCSGNNSSSGVSS